MENKTHKLALGTVQFGLNYGISNVVGQTSSDEVKSILTYARQVGIDLLDTAAAYGISEEVLGKTGCDNFKVVSKFTLSENETIGSKFSRSLECLQTEKLYGYMAHHAALLIQRPNCWTEMMSLKDKGVVKKIGYSLYLPSELETLLSIGLYPDIIQVPFNILDTRFRQYFKELKEKGTEIHTRSSFLQGILLMQAVELKEFFQPLEDVINQLADHFNTIEKRAAALLSFCVDEPFIDKVVIGVNTRNQLRSNVEELQRASALELNIPLLPERIILPHHWPK